MRIQDICSLSSSIRKQIVNSTQQRRIYDSDHETGYIKLYDVKSGMIASEEHEGFPKYSEIPEPLNLDYTLLLAATPSVQGYLHGVKTQLHLDPGAECNVMSQNGYKLIGSPPIEIRENAQMRTASSSTTKFLGVCSGISVKIGGITYDNVTFYVLTRDGDYNVLLGTPFHAMTRMFSRWFATGVMTATITSLDGNKTSSL
jgi:hypothetical protein